ncbi:MAG: MASE1 domain-containing protein [Candidatus Hydrogenedentota bacterium]
MKTRGPTIPILLLAGLYFLVGRLSMLLAIPPGFAVPFWPAAGIALVALLAFGEKLWLGVFLGSLFIYFENLCIPAEAVSWTPALLVSTFIGSGAALQAVVGARMTRRFIGFPASLVRPADIGLFFLLSGVVGSLVSSSCGMLALRQAGLVAAENFFSTGPPGGSEMPRAYWSLLPSPCSGCIRPTMP